VEGLKKEIALLLLMLSALACLAQENRHVKLEMRDDWTPEQGKLNTADASPVDSGKYELEFGYGFSIAKHAWDINGKTQGRHLAREKSIGFALTYGVINDIDVSVALDYLWVRDEENIFPVTGDNIGDLSLSGRWRFFSLEKYSLGAAWVSGFTIPSGSDDNEIELGTSQGFWSWENVLVIDKNWGRGTVNADVGYSLPFGTDRNNARGTFIADFAAGYHIFDWLQPEFELNYSKDLMRNNSDSERLGVTAGFIIPIAESVGIKTGVQQGIWGKNCDKETSFMVSFKLTF